MQTDYPKSEPKTQQIVALNHCYALQNLFNLDQKALQSKRFGGVGLNTQLCFNNHIKYPLQLLLG